MKVITTNLLNRFWKNGVRPIKEALEGKINTSKVVKSKNITEEGFLMDGKTASEAITGLENDKTSFPDYNNIQSLSGNPVTMTEDGYVRLMHRASVARISTIQVNGVLVNRTYMPSGSSFACSTPLIPVKTGDIVNIISDTASAGGQNYQTNVHFIPIKEGK